MVDHLLQSMVVLRGTGVQRRGQRSSSTVMRATLLMSGTHHNVRTQYGLQTHSFSTVVFSQLVRTYSHVSLLLCISHTGKTYYSYSLSDPSIDCGAPQITGNITVNFTTTMFGYNATYHCQGDPSKIYTTQCTSAGVWEPDPNTLKCSQSGIVSVKSNLVHTITANRFCPTTTVLRNDYWIDINRKQWRIQGGGTGGTCPPFWSANT